MNAESIQAAYEKFIETEERRSPSGERRWVYASAWSACTRQMALELVRPDVKPAFSADTLANFRRGNDRARDLKSDMTRVGRECNPPFDVVGAEERFELRDKKGRPVIVGKVDFRLQFANIKGKPPVEVKSWHPNLIQGVKRFEDLFENRWTRKGAYQLLAYMLATNEPIGYMLLDRPGIPRPLEVKLYDHLDRIEDFLKRAEQALDAREAIIQMRLDRGETLEEDELLPAFIDDPAECRVCPFFGTVCQPPLRYEGANFITDEAMLADIELHEALDEPRSQYKNIHDDLSEIMKASTPKTYKGEHRRQTIAGKYLIESWWGKHTTTDLPDAVKAQYQSVDPTGKFNFKIVKVSE